MALVDDFSGEGSDFGERNGKRISTSKWRKLNRVQAVGSDVVWNAFSPPQNRGSQSQSDQSSQSSQSQGNDIGAQISPSVILGNVENRRSKVMPPVRRTRTANRWKKTPSFEEQYNAVAIHPKPKKRNKKIDSLDEEEDGGADAGYSTSSTKTPPEDFPEDDFDDLLMKATQDLEEQQSKAVAETPKRIPSARLCSRRNEFQSGHKDDRKGDSNKVLGVGKAPPSSARVPDMEKKTDPPKATADFDAFSDSDDDLFSQIPMPE